MNAMFVPPVYECHRIDREIQLDGRLGDPLWQTAGVARLGRADTGLPGRFGTELRLLYSSKSLFIGFWCEDTYVWGTHRERDAAVYEQECVEAFLAPASTMHQYYEINVSPLNTVFDACVLNRRTHAGRYPAPPYIGLAGFDVPGLMTAVSVDGDVNQPGKARAWRAEYAVPFDALIGAPNIPPQPGDTWLANFYRIDAPEDGRPEYYAWSATQIIDFHIPQRFGRLVFAE